MVRPWMRAAFFSFVLVTTWLVPGLAQAQAVVDTIDVTGVDESNFPDIAIQVRILDPDGSPITITGDDVVVTEDNAPVAISSRSPVYTGIQVAIVIDAGAGIDSKDGSPLTRAQKIQQAAIRYIESMGEKDSAEIILVDSDGARVVQSLTTDKEVLKSAVNSLRLVTVYDFKPDGTKQFRPSAGLRGIDKALEDLKLATNLQQSRAVLFFSSAIQDGASNRTTYERLETTAKEAQPPIPIHVVGVGQANALDTTLRLASNTRGEAILYNGDPSLDGLYSRLVALRDQYQLIYRSASPGAGERTLVVKASANTLSASDTFRFTVDPNPLPAEIEKFIVNGGNPIRRVAQTYDADRSALDATEVRITAEVFWPDGYPRGISSAQLYVDGQPYGSPQFDPGVNLQFIWDIRNYTNEGISTAKLEIRLQDELGLEGNSNVADVPIEVVIPPPPLPCDGLTGWQDMLCRAREWIPTISSTLALIIAFVALAIALVAFRFRRELQDVASSVGNAIVTTLRFKKMTPKAYLHLLDGAVESGRRVFPLYGTTKIGRDRRAVGTKGGLLFHQSETESPISSLHCLILEESEQFYIRDEGSSNGTFVSGQEIKSDEDPVRLAEGDIVELAQVEMGGLRLRFSLNGNHTDGDSPSAGEGVDTNRTR